jgi:hypothetical protein
MVHGKRKAIIVYKAVIWAMVLASLDPLTLYYISSRCFNKQKVNRSKPSRDKVKNINTNIAFINKRILENCVELLKLE